MEDRASRHWQQCWGVTDSSTEQGLEANSPRRSPEAAATSTPERARARQSGASWFRAQPLRRRGERERERQGGSGRGDAVRLTTRRFSRVCASRGRMSARCEPLRWCAAGGFRKRDEPQGRQRDATSPRAPSGANRRGGARPRGRNGTPGVAAGSRWRRSSDRLREWTLGGMSTEGRVNPRRGRLAGPARTRRRH